MSINAITFDLDDHTLQIVNGDLLIWISGETRQEADIVIRLADMQRILSTANMLRVEP